MKSLIIHAGLHKTGSTSIQNFLGKHREKLAQQGFVYPQFSYGKETFQNHSAPVRLAFSDAPQKLFFTNLADTDPHQTSKHFYRQFEELRQQQGRVLLSAEGFSQFTENELLTFLNFFDGWDVRVILYVRPAYSYHCSAIQEKIKNGSSVSVDKALVTRSADIIKLKAVFSNIEFFHFPDVCSTLGPVGHFVGHLGLTELPVQSGTKDNVGLSNIAVRIANHVHKTIPIRKKNGRYNPQAAKFRASHFSLSDGPFRLTEQELAQIRDAISEENAALSELTGIDFEHETVSCIAPKPLSLKQQLALVGKLSRTPSDITALVEHFVLENNYVSGRLVNNTLYKKFASTAFGLSFSVNQKWRAVMRRVTSSL